MLYMMRYILWVAALLGAVEIIEDDRHLGFYRKLEIIKIKKRKLKILDTGYKISRN